MKQRLERALEVATGALDALANLGGTSSVGNQIAQDILKQIDAILHPVEVEETPVERWTWGGGCTTWATREDAERNAASGSEVYKLTGVCRREKKVVERSGKLQLFADGSYYLTEDGGVTRLKVDCDGIFEWTE